MEKKTILKALLAGTGIAIAVLVISLMLIREPTYKEIILLSKARMESIKNYTRSYVVNLGYHSASGVETKSGIANYTKIQGFPFWSFPIANDTDTIYDMSPENLLYVLENMSGRYLGILNFENGCYEVEATTENTIGVERHLGGYDLVYIKACLDRVTGYPYRYTITVNNLENNKAGVAIYLPVGVA